MHDLPMDWIDRQAAAARAAFDRTSKVAVFVARTRLRTAATRSGWSRSSADSTPAGANHWLWRNVPAISATPLAASRLCLSTWARAANSAARGYRDFSIERTSSSREDEAKAWITFATWR